MLSSHDHTLMNWEECQHAWTFGKLLLFWLTSNDCCKMFKSVCVCVFFSFWSWLVNHPAKEIIVFCSQYIAFHSVSLTHRHTAHLSRLLASPMYRGLCLHNLSLITHCWLELSGRVVFAWKSINNIRSLCHGLIHPTPLKKDFMPTTAIGLQALGQSASVMYWAFDTLRGEGVPPLFDNCISHYVNNNCSLIALHYKALPRLKKNPSYTSGLHAIRIIQLFGNLSPFRDIIVTESWPENHNEQRCKICL